MPRKSTPVEPVPGSPSGEPVYLTVGFLRRPHGIHGEIIMDVHTDFPDRLRAGAKVFVGEDRQPMRIASTRPHGNSLLVAFRGIDTSETVGRLRNTWVYVTAANRPPLPDGKPYQHQIVGLRAITDDGRELGKLTDILETGANDVYVVKSESGAEILLPAIPDVILGYDLSAGVIRVHLIEGLIE